MVSSSELEKFRNKNFEDENATDVKDIKIDTDKTVSERIKEFTDKAENPYFLKVNDITVKLSFGNGKRLKDSIADLLMAG